MNPAHAAPSTSAIEFSANGHYFTARATDVELDDVIRTIDHPLSVIYQVTRRCNFDCDFCSVTARVKDPTLEEIARIQGDLRGVQRVFLSGGEPLLRKDFMDIVGIFEEHIIGVPTNATRGHALADQLAGRVAFVKHRARRAAVHDQPGPWRLRQGHARRRPLARCRRAPARDRRLDDQSPPHLP